MAKAAVKQETKAVVKSKTKIIKDKDVEIVGKGKDIAVKSVVDDSPLMKFQARRANISEFLADRIKKTEAKTGMVANTAKYLDPQTTNSLCLDWSLNGGLFNAMTIVSGPEQAGKTTVSNEVLASGLLSSFVWSSFVDAEGTLNDKYFAAMMRKLGIDLTGMQGRPFRYYKENVIETVFDYMVGLLNDLPRKVWNVEAGSWTYHFPKNNPFAKALMERYEVNVDRKLTTDKFFVCPTDHSGIEASFTVDSFAAMLTENDEENEERSKVRAAEASAFSLNLKRVASKISNRGVLLFGVNQTRDVPNAGPYGVKTYQPGGKALGFYSAQRLEFNSRSSGWPTGNAAYDTKLKCVVEPSIFDGYYDRYAYKASKNTKNKMGNPGKETWIRIWQADYQGKAHGIDPAFDVMQYLQHTNQIVKTNRKGKAQNYKFTILPSLGSKRANFLNAIPEFTELALKTLTLSEVFKTREVIKLAHDRMDISRNVNLRESLFAQMRLDPAVLALNNGRGKSLADDEDYEDDVKEL